MEPTYPKPDRPRSLPCRLLAIIACFAMASGGCALGPHSLSQTRLRYNEAVKTTSEQQLLLNIVRLRYVDTPSSLAISSIADQQELLAGLGIVPFFASAGAGGVAGYESSILPQAQLSRATRPTLSYTPLDDEEFTRKLFTPISLEGAAYLARTTWPISTVCRLYLENLNWVSNAETASGPTPANPPEYATFLEGILALQRLQDRNLITLYTEEREEIVTGPLPPSEANATNTIESVRNNLQWRTVPEGVALVRPTRQPVLRVDPSIDGDEDWMTFCNAFKLDPSLRTFDLTSGQLDPYLKDLPANGADRIDLETRSLLQVLFFVSQGVDVPASHLTSGVAPCTSDLNGGLFDWQQVLGGLFRVHCSASKKTPPCAYAAVRYKDHWFYIDQRDRDSKATFALLLEVSRLELASTESRAPILTLPLGR